MSIFRNRLRIVLVFAVLIVAAVGLSRVLAPGNAKWAAALPWVLLVLFWVYLALMSWLDRRRGRAE